MHLKMRFPPISLELVVHVVLFFTMAVVFYFALRKYGWITFSPVWAIVVPFIVCQLSLLSRAIWPHYRGLVFIITHEVVILFGSGLAYWILA
jgi:hypothetical protein